MTVHHADATPDKVATGERSTLRAVAIPTEHGGWSLTLEPGYGRDALDDLVDVFRREAAARGEVGL